MSGLDDRIRSVVRTIGESAPGPPPLRPNRKPPLRLEARGPVVAVVSFVLVIGLFTWFGFLADNQGQTPATEAAQPSTTKPPMTTSSTSPASSTSVVSPTTPELFVWPLEDGPDRYAVIEKDRIQPVGFADSDILAIPNVRTGVIIGDEMLFGLEDASGVWIWPPKSGMEIPGGQEPIGLLVGQTGTETSPWFHDAAVVEGRPMILYGEIESETDPNEVRMILYDLQSGQTVQLFDKFTRRDGLSQEEQGAPIADAALASDRIAALFAFGDTTWIEWYDLEGSSIAPPESLEAIDGTILEIAIAEDKIVLGVETELHRLITQVWMADLQTGEITGPFIHATSGQSLHHLAFDGRWLTATITEPSGAPVGSYFADTTNQTAEVSTHPIAIAPARD